MTQVKYNLSPLKEYLKQYPNASNDDLYSLCNATTDSQKSSVRKKKQRLTKKKTDTKIKGPITSISPDNVEKIILMRLNGELTHISDSLIRSTVDYLIKVKLSEGEEMEQLDMEKFIYNADRKTDGS